MNIIKAPSPNFNERPSPIDSIIIHYTDMESAEAALAWLTNPESRVSAHYLIDERGQIYQMVAEDKRAWHAGESYWQGRTNLNDCSIGIELANLGHSHGYQTFPDVQIASLIELCLEIKTRWDIPISRILGHSDIAPLRKQDPGHLFPWERLTEVGLGVWPSFLHSPLPFDSGTSCLRSGRMENVKMNTVPSTVRPERRHEVPESKDERKRESVARLTEILSTIGYDITSPTHALTAFQRHFQPHKVDGVADQETYALLNGLLDAQKKLI